MHLDGWMDGSRRQTGEYEMDDLRATVGLTGAIVGLTAPTATLTVAVAKCQIIRQIAS
jgi:hypothetical protein